MWNWKVVRTSRQFWKSVPSSGLYFLSALTDCLLNCIFPVSSKLHFAQGPARWGAGTILWHHFLIGLHSMVALFPRISKFRLFEPLCLIQLFTTTHDYYIRNKMYRICMLIIVKHQWKISKKIWIESSVHVLLCLNTLQAKMSVLPKLDLHT